MTDRPPHLNKRKAPLQQVFGVFGEYIAHALGRGPLGVVIVHAADDLANLFRFAQFVIGGAQRVIKNDDAFGAALGFDQRLHLRIVDPADFILVVEVGDIGVVAQEAKSMALQREFLRMGTAVMNGYAARIGLAARARIAAAG